MSKNFRKTTRKSTQITHQVWFYSENVEILHIQCIVLFVIIENHKISGLKIWSCKIIDKWDGPDRIAEKLSQAKSQMTKKRLGQNTNNSFAFCPHLMSTCQDVYREKMSELWIWICCIFPVTAKNAVLALDHKQQNPTIKWFCQVAKIDEDTNNSRVAEALRTEE